MGVRFFRSDARQALAMLENIFNVRKKTLPKISGIHLDTMGRLHAKFGTHREYAMFDFGIICIVNYRK